MELLRVVGVGLLGVLLANLIRRDKPELHLLVLVTTGVMVLVIVLSSMSTAITAFGTLLATSGVESHLFAGVLKIVGIGYLTEYAASICADCGAASVATKIQLAGKIAIFLMGLPIITSLVRTVASLV